MFSACGQRDWIRERHGGGWGERCSREIRSYFWQSLRLVDVNPQLGGRKGLVLQRGEGGSGDEHTCSKVWSRESMERT